MPRPKKTVNTTVDKTVDKTVKTLTDLINDIVDNDVDKDVDNIVDVAEPTITDIQKTIKHSDVDIVDVVQSMLPTTIVVPMPMEDLQREASLFHGLPHARYTIEYRYYNVIHRVGVLWQQDGLTIAI